MNRNFQMNFASAIALAAAKDTGAATAATAETKTAETPQATPFSFQTINKKNLKEVGKAIWASIEAKDKDGKLSQKFDDKNDVLQELLAAVRNERDASKNTRPRKELEVILKEAIGKPMGDLQAVKVPLMGVSINIPQLIKIATSVHNPEKGEAPHPLKETAVKFMKDHNITIVEEKKGSRGRKTTTLVNGDISKLAA